MADQNFNINCGFFDAINNDRLYSASDMTRPYRRIVTDGVFATPSGTASTDLQVVSANNGMGIICKKGEGVFGNKWFESQSNIAITVPANAESNPRRDSVIAQVDTRRSYRVGRIVYRTGTPAASPVPPNIGTVDGVIEYRIANVYVASGATSINNDAIVDLRGSSECPWVTGLIKQVDTSQLYNQWNTAYQNYYDSETQRMTNYINEETEAFNEFMSGLTEQLTVETNIATFESHFVSTVDGTTEVPINISGFNKAKDVLMVRVNRLFASEGTDYTISNDSSKITLTNDIKANNNVDFLVLKSIVSGDNATVMQQLQAMNAAISAMNTDGGWINFTLEGGATAYDNNNKPAVRKYGNRTNIRGAIKGVTAAGTVVCTLPAAYKPAIDHVYTTTAVSGSNVTATITMQVLASTGQVKLLAKTGTIGASDMVSIATNFIVG